MRRLALLFLALSPGACESFPPAPPPPPSLPPPKPAPPPPPVKVDAAGPPPLVHVTIRGKVEVPPGAGGSILLVVTDGPCFLPGTHYLATRTVKPGPYSVDLFPPLGSRLEVCATVVNSAVRTTPYLGRGARTPLLVATLAANRFEEVGIKVQRGAVVVIPEGIKID